MPFWDLLGKKGHDCRFYHALPNRYEHYRVVGWRLSQKLRKLTTSLNLSRAKKGDFDSIVIETGLLHDNDFTFEKDIRRFAKRMVYDIDDGVFLLFPEKCAAIAHMADHVIAGNQRIADWAYTHNSSVSIIPTCVDSNLYRGKSEQDYDSPLPLIIGWVGSAGNLAFLQVLRQPLTRLAANFDFRFRVISQNPERIRSEGFGELPCDFIDIDSCDVAGEVAKFDIGVMPLPQDEPWMEYKSNAKMIQYMASGVAPVATALGLNLDLISQGKTGWLATDDDEWTEGLALLLGSTERRRQMGLAARQFVLERYTVQSQLEPFTCAVFGDA